MRGGAAPTAARGSAQRSAHRRRSAQRAPLKGLRAALRNRGCGARSGLGAAMGLKTRSSAQGRAAPIRATYAVTMSGGVRPAPAPGSRRFVCVGVSTDLPIRLRASFREGGGAQPGPGPIAVPPTPTPSASPPRPLCDARRAAPVLPAPSALLRCFQAESSARSRPYNSAPGPLLPGPIAVPIRMLGARPVPIAMPRTRSPFAIPCIPSLAAPSSPGLIAVCRACCSPALLQCPSGCRGPIATPHTRCQ